MSTEQARQVFTGATAAVRALHGSTQDVDEVTVFQRSLSRMPGASQNLLQLFSRGGILAGVASDAARSMNLPMIALQRGLSEGSINTRRLILSLTDYWVKTQIAAAIEAGNSIEGWKNRVEDAFQDVERKTAVRNAIVQFLTDVRDTLKDPAMREAASEWGRLLRDAFQAGGTAAKFLGEHADGDRGRPESGSNSSLGRV
jgi:hypothetical protein